MVDDVDMEAFCGAVAGVLAEAEKDIAARRPVCRASGRCCRFEEYGHRMYVTAGELELFGRAYAGETQNAKLKARNSEEGGEGRRVSLGQFFEGEAKGCPYQVEGLCTAREARPLGCRVYFCDENAQGWQAEVYEKYHGRIKALHEEYGVAYRYMEWREGLRRLNG